MEIETLGKARKYEELNEGLVSNEARPAFHFSPRIGWLNDPNGFSFYRGKYHLFYQYHPYSTYWGPMHWGHAVSSDLINWEYLPAALAPDTAYDNKGCFSGSALALPDGRQLIIYTGCEADGLDPLGRDRWRQLQCIAVSADANPSCTDYIKYDGNPVIGTKDVPEGCDTYEFRDPYMWPASDGTYRALVASGRTGRVTLEHTYEAEGGTRLLLYGSKDGFHWEYLKTLFEDDRRIGIMWECPNFFELDGRQVLIASPMDMALEEGEAEGSVRFPQGNNVCYIVGSYDEEAEEFVPESTDAGYRYEPVDLGLDFYAPQVTRAADGRCIMIGWMQDPKSANLIEAGAGQSEAGTEYAVETDGKGGYVHGAEGTRIFGQMTVPRELRLIGGRLYQKPVRELEKYRKDKLQYSGMHLHDEERILAGISGRVLDMEIEISPAEGSGNADGASEAAADATSYEEFSIEFAKDEKHCIKLTYRPDKSVLTVDRSMSGQCDAIPAKRSIKVRDLGGTLGLRLLIDKWSAEVFINDGEQTMSLTFYTPQEADGIRFGSKGSLNMNVSAYKICRD